jgi:hypothetical protein
MACGVLDGIPLGRSRSACTYVGYSATTHSCYVHFAQSAGHIFRISRIRPGGRILKVSIAGTHLYSHRRAAEMFVIPSCLLSARCVATLSALRCRLSNAMAAGGARISVPSTSGAIRVLEWFAMASRLLYSAFKGTRSIKSSTYSRAEHEALSRSCSRHNVRFFSLTAA